MKKGDIHIDSFSIPLKFLSDNKHSITELRTYLWLRMITIDTGGYTPENYIKNFKRNTRERIIPKLIKLGWVIKAGNRLKINSVYKITENWEKGSLANKIMCKVPYKIIQDKNRLKAHIFAMIESFIMQGKWNSENKGYLSTDRETKKLTRQRIKKSDSDCTKTVKLKGGVGELKNITQQGTKYLCSRISHSILQKWGFSSKEISRLRRHKINTYFAKELKKSNRYDVGSFYSWKRKGYYRILPTKLLTPIGNVFYKDYPKYLTTTITASLKPIKRLINL